MKLRKKSSIAFLLMLAVIFAATGFAGNTVKATTKSFSYSVKKGSPDYFSYKNPNSSNSVTCNITGRPTSGTAHKVLVSVYSNSNYDGTPLATQNFVGGDPGTIMHVTIPAGKTYYFKVSTTTAGVTVSGTLKIVH